MLMINLISILVITLWSLYIVRGVSGRVLQESEYHLLRRQRTYKNARRKKAQILRERKRWESRVFEIFTLYDLTREITRNFNEQNAFQVFENKLRDNVRFRECRLLASSAAGLKEWQERKDYELIPLRGRRKRLGYLAIQELMPDDREKLNILAHQFTLALRRIRLYQQIEQLAITDSLTNCYTRRHILERFEEELERAGLRQTYLSFLMIDIDFFKRFNDQYGHLTGDQILRKISRILKANIREIDIIGRYGGEEFCVVLPDTDSSGANYVAERIRSAVDESTIRAYDTVVEASVSIGISTFPMDGRKTDELIDKADWALYRAKKLGRNKICSFGIYSDEPEEA